MQDMLVYTVVEIILSQIGWCKLLFSEKIFFSCACGYNSIPFRIYSMEFSRHLFFLFLGKVQVKFVLYPWLFFYFITSNCLCTCRMLSRGRKWNPLRQRLDSYDYTVKQHIVGSLLFTPLLLLLPTTSVFYIFFTIMNTTINLIYILIEITISVIHATPYIKIFLWLVMPKRFPSGIWFEIVSVWSDCIYSHKDISSPADKLQSEKGLTGEKASVVVSFLHSNFLTVGESSILLFSELVMFHWIASEFWKHHLSTTWAWILK